MQDYLRPPNENETDLNKPVLYDLKIDEFNSELLGSSIIGDA